MPSSPAAPVPLRWGMLSTAGIGRVVATALSRSPGAEFAAVASRDAERAAGFAAEIGVPLSFGSYEELLASDEVDAVYICLPVAMHTEWTIKALQAGKHVLCEKPFAMTAADAAACFDAAETAGRHCIEGLMYRHHPQTTVARKLLADGAIGELSTVRAALTVSAPPGNIRRVRAMGGGALLDLGCYCISALRLFAGEPDKVYAISTADPSEPNGVDLHLAGTVSLPRGVLGQFDVGLDLFRRDELELVGTTGKIVIPDPWICQTASVQLHTDGSVVTLPADPDDLFALTDPEHDAYRIEFDVASAIICGQVKPTHGRVDAIAQAAAL
jgi:xylose dehydrogenase (NAD/NADP)